MIPRWIRWSLLISLVVGVPLAHAETHIQYLLATGEVTGAGNRPVQVPSGYAALTLAEDPDAITWPVPAGCAAGMPEWTEITAPETVAADGTGMAVRAGLLFFTSTSTLWTGCAQVISAAQLEGLVEAAILTALGTNSALATAIPRLRGHTQGRCPDANMSANCQAARAALATLDSATLSEAELDTILTEAVTLRADAANFISTNFP